MKQILTEDPTHFDNSVIVVDEIHNLTRLISGKLDKYLKPPKVAKPGKKRKIPASYEPITVDKWVPKLQGADTRYDRAFLFYNLFVKLILILLRLMFYYTYYLNEIIIYH
jgi:hypothetical protein